MLLFGADGYYECMSSMLAFALLLVFAQDSVDLRTVAVEAFRVTHDGYSSDEVILNDELNAKFIAACQQQIPDVSPAKCNWTLINLRKAGKLSGIKTTKRSHASTDDYRILAEIVSRSVLDRFGVSIDRVMAEPEMRAAFNALAKEHNAKADLYLVRKAAFQLRKARQLRPELITRIADWGRMISKFKVAEFAKDENLAPELPGIYIFHDRSGYLYIGQSDNLRTRLKNHLQESSNLGLGGYLESETGAKDNVFVEIHAFPLDSRAKEVRIRRAYESELIRSRKPRFNILP